MNTLHQDIQAEINAAGGRIRLAAQIISESPQWFTITEKRSMKKKLYDIVRPRREPKRPPPIRWSEEDIGYILDQYGKQKTRFLSKVIGKSPEAIRMKFHKVATPERKAQLEGKYHTWQNNFKQQLFL